jgi:hypothetical protein
MIPMKVMTARVAGGKIELDTDLQDGTPLVILAKGETGFQLTQEDEDELFQALEEIRNGNYEDSDELLSELRSMYRR